MKRSARRTGIRKTKPRARHRQPALGRLSPARAAGALAALWLLALGLQWFNGAWQADFGAHPDEAAHVVTGLMIRDYIAGGFLTEFHPLRYAETYYDHFPRVALGHYPPGFYLTEALFFLPAPVAGAALVHNATIAAALAALMFLVGRRLTGNSPLAFAGAAVLLLLPVVQRYTAVIMADLMVALLMLLSALAFARFLVTGSRRDSLLFGLLAAATILTKGSGLLLALLPPLAIALTGRWSLIKAPALWLAPVPVLLLALPWMWFTHDISAEGMRGVPLLQHIREALTFYPGYLPRLLGWGWTLLLAAGIVTTCLTLLRNRAAPAQIAQIARPACLLALVLALYGFHVFCPIGLEDRYLLPALPPLMLLALGVAQSLLRAADLPPRAAWVPAALVLLLAGVEVIRATPKDHRGFTALAAPVAAAARGDASRSSTTNVLVSSDARGEGAYIAAAAFAVRQRSDSPLRVLRSSQQIASSDWMGRGYQLAATNPAEIEALLDQLDVAWVVVDPGLTDRTRRPHHQLMVDWWQTEHHRAGQPATTDPGAPVLVER